MNFFKAVYLTNDFIELVNLILERTKYFHFLLKSLDIRGLLCVERVYSFILVSTASIHYQAPRRLHLRRIFPSLVVMTPSYVLDIVGFVVVFLAFRNTSCQLLFCGKNERKWPRNIANCRNHRSSFSKWLLQLLQQKNGQFRLNTFGPLF